MKIIIKEVYKNVPDATNEQVDEWYLWSKGKGSISNNNPLRNLDNIPNKIIKDVRQ